MNGSGKVQAKWFFPFLSDGLRHESCDEESCSQEIFIKGSELRVSHRSPGHLCANGLDTLEGQVLVSASPR